MFKHNKHLVPFAKNLRKNMTKEEKHLWYDFLSKYPIPFIRQKVLGDYIADFYCCKAKLVIELDGSQHYSEKGLEYDARRDDYLKREYGIRVIRISNLDIMRKFNEVCYYIDFEVKQSLSLTSLDSSL